jgi:hypothetical protein
MIKKGQEMQESKYLSLGEKLGGHYEIVKVLGEDDFEILYLVKDRHLKENLFVLKELFLEGISFRDANGTLHAPAKSKYVFDETKKEVILETNRLQVSNHKQEPETYGYFEEHNTVYIIMEFSNDVNLEHYLNIEPSEERVDEEANPEIALPLEEEEKAMIQEPIAKIKKEKKSPVFLIGLIILVAIFAGLAYYAFKMIEEDKEKSKKRPSNTTVEVIPVTPKPMSHPTLTTRDNRSKKSAEDMVKNEMNKSNEKPSFPEESVAYLPPSSKAYMEKNHTSKSSINLEGIPKEEVSVNTQPNLNPVFPENSVVANPITTENEFNKKSVGQFLGRFGDALSSASINRILSFYDRDVQKYFSLTRVKHEDIRIDREAYNKKWEYRDIRIGSFKILKTYTEHRVEYCDVEARLKWSLSTSNFKSDLGVSIEWITLKKTPDGFKIKSIYLLK